MALPVLQALLVADHVYQDMATGKFVICGIFGTIFFAPKEDDPTSQPRPMGDDDGGGAGGKGNAPEGGSSPGQSQMPIARLIRAGSPSAYVSLREVHGQRRFELRYVDLDENTVLFSTEFGVECRNPLETIQLSMPLPPLPVPHEGVFVLELLCEGELLGSHRVLTKKQPPHP
jgi:hypothetical protein